MLKPFLADLHVHTVLSGCAEVEMIPPLILRQAKRLGLSLIAILNSLMAPVLSPLLKMSVPIFKWVSESAGFFEQATSRIRVNKQVKNIFLAVNR